MAFVESGVLLIHTYRIPCHTAAHMFSLKPMPYPPSPVGMLLLGQRQQLASFSGGAGRGGGVCGWRRRPKYLVVGAAVGETVFVVKQQEHQPFPSGTVANPRSGAQQQIETRVAVRAPAAKRKHLSWHAQAQRLFVCCTNVVLGGFNDVRLARNLCRDFWCAAGQL